MSLLTLLGAVATLVAAVGAVVVPLLVRRAQSRTERLTKGGSIQSSEAADLWREGENLREYLTAQLEKRDAKITQLGTDIAHCQELCEERRQEAEECRERERALARQLEEQAAKMAEALARLDAAGL